MIVPAYVVLAPFQPQLMDNEVCTLLCMHEYIESQPMFGRRLLNIRNVHTHGLLTYLLTGEIKDPCLPMHLPESRHELTGA